MWNRELLKQKGKEAFKRNYWMSVLVAMILMLCVGGSGVTLNIPVNDNNVSDELFMEDSLLDSNPLADFSLDGFFTAIGFFIIIIIVIALIVSLLLTIFVFGPLEVGCCNFFKKNAYEKADFGCVGFGFNKNHYKNIMTIMFFRRLYIALWTLFLIVPGVIKAYEYLLVPYILADCPDMSREDAFRISKEMMDGNKMKAFLLELSFFGWIVLSVITCNIVGLFYVQPYMAATEAELFIAIREEFFNKQRVDVCE